MAASNKPRHRQFFNNINSLILEGLPSASADPRSEYIPLPASFQPSNVDVICGRGRGYYNCAGNILFRETVQSFVDYYTSQPNKSAKTAVLVEIVQYMKDTLKAKFVKQRPNQEGGGGSVWCELSDFLAREKVGNAMREAIAASSRNNNHHIAQRTLSPCPPKPEPSSSSAKDVTMDMDVEMKTSTTAATLNADFSSARQRRRSSSHDKIFGRRIAFLTDRCIQQQYHRHHQQNQSVMSTGSSLASSSSSSTRQMQLSTNSATTTEIVQDDDAIMSTVLPEGGSSEFFIMDTAESMLLSTTTTTMKCSSASV